MQRSRASCLVVIPARYGSTRLPGKPLLRDTGKFLVQHVYERACLAACASRVLVATDDPRILQAVRSFGGEAVLTEGEFRSGTDRVAWASRSASEAIVINVQGDEPRIAPEVIDAVAEALFERPRDRMATAVTSLKVAGDLARPQVVKTVLDRRGYALYFSRSPIPYVRDAGAPVQYLKHLGLYGYRSDFLQEFVKLPEGALERAESLEQLRALEAGVPIRAIEVDYDGMNVDTFEDYKRFIEAERGAPA